MAVKIRISSLWLGVLLYSPLSLQHFHPCCCCSAVVSCSLSLFCTPSLFFPPPLSSLLFSLISDQTFFPPPRLSSRAPGSLSLIPTSSLFQVVRTAKEEEEEAMEVEMVLFLLLLFIKQAKKKKKKKKQQRWKQTTMVFPRQIERRGEECGEKSFSSIVLQSLW